MADDPRNPVLADYTYPHRPQHTQLLDALRRELKRYGLNVLRADDKSYVASLWGNVAAYMDACDLGIAVFEQINDQDFNPNVSLELGYMMAKQKRILLLKEEHLETLPTDIVGQLYRSFDHFNIAATVGTAIRDWLRDMGIAKSRSERLVLFVSLGGTCRCAMAKVVLSQALRGRELPYRLRVQSIAHRFGSSGKASNAARNVARDVYGSDPLADHVVTERHPGIIEDADLILVMESALVVDLPGDKTYIFTEFFGLSGDVLDPWPPDGPDSPGAPERYRTCLSHLRSVIDSRADKVVSYLNKIGAAV
jgi:protein-tyrosine-phosphatase